MTWVNDRLALLMDKLSRPSRQFDIVGVGENSWDVLVTVPHWPSPNEKLELLNRSGLPGGQVASALVGCTRLGCSTQYLGVFGDDEHGRNIAEALGQEGVDISACPTVRAPNRSAFIVVDASAGTRAVLWQRDPALRWPNTSDFANLIARARALLVDATDIEAAIAAAHAAKSAGVPVFLDIDREDARAAELLENVDVVIAAEGFCETHTGARSSEAAMAAIRARYHPTMVVVTHGPNGALAWDGANTVSSPGFVVPVADPTGAGDAFRAGFVAATLQGATSLLEVLEFANATAALNCRAVGAQTGLPTRAEVRRLLTDPGVQRSNQAGSAGAAGR